MSAEIKVNPAHNNLPEESRQMSSSSNDQDKGCTYYLLYGISILGLIITFPFCLCVCIKIVQDYERAVIYRLGRLLGAKGPGIFFIIPCIDNYIKVDLRTVSFDVPPQEVLTRDSVTIAVDAVVYYKIFDAEKSVNEIANASLATRQLAQTTLRDQLGTKTLAGILADREELSHNMQSILDKATDAWGISVERVELKDVRLPQSMQRAMAAEAEATREAQAKVIAAKGELDASVALKEAADVISQSSGALQLRYLQTLTTISAERNSTIIFPLPMDILPLANGNKKVTNNF